MITWVVGGRRSGPIPIYNSTNSINTLSNIEQGKVVDLFRTTSISCTIAPNIYYLGVRVAGMGPVSTSTISTNIFFHITRGKVAGLFRPRFTSTIINSYISPWVDIITTYISRPISIIKTDINLILFIYILIFTTRRNWRSQKYTTVTWVMVGRVASLRPISTTTNITTMITSTTERGRVYGIKISMSAFTSPEDNSIIYSSEISS